MQVKLLALVSNGNQLVLLEINSLKLGENYEEILVLEIQVVYELHADVKTSDQFILGLLDLVEL
jgi:hypothetical protein